MADTRYALWIRGRRWSNGTFRFHTAALIFAYANLLDLGVQIHEIEVRPELSR